MTLLIFNAILKIERNDSIKAGDYYGIVWKINSPNTGMFNVNFDINVNEYIQNPKIILKRCLLITIIIVISHILSSTYEPSITITEEPSVTLE